MSNRYNTCKLHKCTTLRGRISLQNFLAPIPFTRMKEIGRKKEKGKKSCLETSLAGDNFECSQVFNRRLRRERGGRGWKMSAAVNSISRTPTLTTDISSFIKKGSLRARKSNKNPQTGGKKRRASHWLALLFSACRLTWSQAACKRLVYAIGYYHWTERLD